jgi:hypothetical protein
MTPVADDVSLDNETPMVTSSISKFVGSTQFFEGAHKGECMLWYIKDFRI